MNLIKIDGIEIPSLDFIPYKIGDLIYQESPVLSHFVDNENYNNHYFYKWTDCDDFVNRWLVFKVSSSNIYSFLYK